MIGDVRLMAGKKCQFCREGMRIKRHVGRGWIHPDLSWGQKCVAGDVWEEWSQQLQKERNFSHVVGQ